LPLSNVSLPGGPPSTRNEPRVPPLPNELVAAASTGKRSKSHANWKSIGNHVTPASHQQQKKKENKQQQLHREAVEDLRKGDAISGSPLSHSEELLQSLKIHGRYEALVVQESTRVGITEDLAKEVKECKVELERIDQELLELGPFAKDVFHEVSSSQKSDPVLLPGMVNPRGNPVGSTPELFIHHYQHPSPVRRSRKGNRQSSNKQASKQSSVAKKKSEDGYASSPMSTSSASLGDERSEVGDRLSTRDNENLGKGQQQANSQKGKWRKVGSSGSPSVPPAPQIFKNMPNAGVSSTHTSNNNGLSSTEANHYVSPMTTTSSKEKKVKQPRSSNTSVSGKEFDTDVNSPSSMIPAASEIEMLSLYMPTSPWETIGSSPLQSDHVSNLDIQGSVGSNSLSEKATEGHRKTESDKSSSRSICSPQSASSQLHSRSEKPSSVEASPGVATPPQKQHPLVAMTSATSGSSNWQSLLASSTTSHSSDKQSTSQLEARSLTPNSHQAATTSSSVPGNELKRHVVVRDGTPVCMPSSTSKAGFSVSHLASTQDQAAQRREQQDQPNPPHYQQQHPSVTHMVREHRASMSAERYSPPTGLGSPVVGHPHSHHFNNMEMASSRHRRTSSSSSLRSLKQQHSVDDNMSTHSLPSPLPNHSRVSGSRQTSSPLTQQALQQMQAMGGVSVGDPKLGNAMLGNDSTKLPLINPATGMPWVPSTSAAASQLAGPSGLVGHSASVANAMSAAGLPCYPFSFLPGPGNWFQTPGGMLASAGLAPSLRPPMLSIDPSSAYKPVFNPLLNYRYPLGVSQSLKGFPSSSSPQLSQPPSGVGLGNINPTSAGSPAPQGAVYPVAPSPNLPGFHSRGDPVIMGTRNSQPNAGTLPLLCLQPGQAQAFPGMLPQSLIASGAEDANSGTGTTKGLEASLATPPSGISWVQNPSGTNLVPYLMGQAQLAVPPGSQQAVNLLANSQLAGATFHGSDGNLTKMGGGPPGIVNSGNDHPATFAPHRPQPQRRGSSASVDLVRGEISPSNTPPLGVGQGGGVGLNIGGSNRPLSGKGSHDAKWKPGGDHSSNPLVIHPFEYPSGDSSQSPTHAFSSASNVQMVSPSGHMIQAGFPGMPMMHGHSRLPKGRGEMLIGAGGRGSPRAIADKPKLRMHHVRDDDFRQPVKPDRRRKRWRGKNRESYLSVRSEETDGSRYGVGKVGDPLPSTLPPFPRSMNVEPGNDQAGRSRQHVKYPLHDEDNGLGVPKSVKPGTKSKDGNYALNILADMSSIQSKERHDGSVAVPMSLCGSHTNESSSNNIPSALPVGQVSSEVSRHHMRSPVTLAARSLLMLGEDLNKPISAKGKQPQSVENNAANSLLQLSNAMLSGKDNSADATSEQIPVNENGSSSSQSTRSASFSAAEAMIMMGSASEPTKEVSSCTSAYNEVFTSSMSLSPLSGDRMETQEVGAVGVPKLSRIRSQRPQSISLDSEVTDTDSEATLTPDSPRPPKLKYPPELIPFNEDEDEANADEANDTVLVESSPMGAGLTAFQSGSGGACDHEVEKSEVLEEDDLQSGNASDSGQCESWDPSVQNSPNSKGTSKAVYADEPIITTYSSSFGSYALSQAQTQPKEILQDNSEGKLPPKLPKFISSFGPVSENVTPSLPVEFDQRDEGNNSPSDLKEPLPPHALEKDESTIESSREEKINSATSSSLKGQTESRDIDDSCSTPANEVLAEDPAVDSIEPALSSEGTPKMNSPLSSTKERTKQRVIKIKRHNTRVVPVSNTASSEVPTPGHYSDASGSLPSWAAFADAAKLSSTGGKDKDKDSHIFALGKLSDDDSSDASSITDGILSSGELSRVNKVIESMDENLAQQSSQEVALEIISDGNESPNDISTTLLENDLPHSDKTPELEQVGKHHKMRWDPQICLQQLSPGIENAGGNGKVYKAQRSSKSLAYSKNSREHESRHDQHDTSIEKTSNHAGSDSDNTLTTTRKPQRLLHGSPNRNSHKQYSANKPVDRFSPLSDDEMVDLSSSSQHHSHKDFYSKCEGEDSEKRQKRYQGDYCESAATLVPSPASSTSSSSTKKRHSHHHHRHVDRFTGGDLLLSNKREHRKEKSGSASRGSSPAEHKKRHRHHHHSSSHHHRAHPRDETRSRESHTSHEGKDDRSFVGSSRLGRDDWHDSGLVVTTSSGGKNRKRVHVSSDEEGGAQDYSKTSSFKSNSKRKMKRSRDHKERWKEHQHGLHKH